MEFLVVKTVLFIEMSIFFGKKSFYFELCTHVQNSIFWLKLFIIGKNPLEINGLLLYNYLIILGHQKNTKGMDLWGCYHVPFWSSHSCNSPTRAYELWDTCVVKAGYSLCSYCSYISKICLTYHTWICCLEYLKEWSKKIWWCGYIWISNRGKFYMWLPPIDGTYIQ